MRALHPWRGQWSQVAACQRFCTRWSYTAVKYRFLLSARRCLRRAGTKDANKIRREVYGPLGDHSPPLVISAEAEENR